MLEARPCVAGLRNAQCHLPNAYAKRSAKFKKKGNIEMFPVVYDPTLTACQNL